jgi:hypothetical protein
LISYEQLGESFHARHLAVPMDLAFHLDAAILARRGAELLLERNFDQAPVLRDGEMVGFVLRGRLEDSPNSTVGHLTTPLGPGNIVSADASVRQLLDWIANPGFLFVLNGREFVGFVTVSDFNKQPARAYLYLLIATFESGLADLIRRRFADDQEAIFELLSDDDGHRIRDRFIADQRDNVEADPVSYLGFSHLIGVVSGDERLRTWIGVTRNAWERDSGSLVGLRNSVMHPVRSLVERKDGLLRLQRREARLRRLSDLVAMAIGTLSRQPTDKGDGNGDDQQ